MLRYDQNSLRDGMNRCALARRVSGGCTQDAGHLIFGFPVEVQEQTMAMQRIETVVRSSRLRGVLFAYCHQGLRSCFESRKGQELPWIG